MNAEKKIKVQDIYPLSSAQKGMLFHSLYSPNSGEYVEQLSYKLTTDNPEILKEAWARIQQKFEVFRSSFVWKKHDDPLQVVRESAELPWQELDWRDLPEQEKEEKIEAFLKEDRFTPFSLAKAPLMRFVLIRLSENRYQFIWTFHHLLMDGWSLSIVLKTFVETLEAIRKGNQVNLHNPTPFKNYISWLKKQNVDKAENYWTEELSGFIAPTPLGIEKQKSKRQPDAEKGYVVKSLELSEKATQQLQETAQTHLLTVSSLVQTAWACMLKNYSGEQDVLFGSVVSGRPTTLPGVEQMVGVFLNTLPLRVNLESELPFIEQVKTVHEKSVRQNEFEHISLVDIQNWSQVPRELPLFESIVVFENYPMDPSALSLGDGQPIEDGKFVEWTNFPLTVTVTQGEKLNFQIAYDLRKFEEQEIDRVLNQYALLLEQIAENPTGKAADFSLLTEEEKEQLLTQVNQTDCEYPKNLTVAELFEQKAQLYPENIAVNFEGKEQLTYKELSLYSNQLAQYLCSLNIGVGDCVGISLNRSPMMLVALLAVIKSGGTYVPLDPSFPTDRLRYMVEDSKASILLTETSLTETYEGLDTKTIALDREWRQIQKEFTDSAVAKISGPEDLVYILYTSGSTGRPKGVQIPHRALVNFLNSVSKVPGLSHEETLLAVTTLSFDISMLELFLPLIQGACIHLVGKEMASDGFQLAKEIQTSGATLMQATPATWQMLIDADWKGKQDLRVICGGEALPRKLATQLIDRTEGLWNFYGPTETTIWSTEVKVEERDTPIRIGKPMDNTQVYVLDEFLNPLPALAPGELHIGGDGVAKGYLNRPELTEEKFINDPFSDKEATKLYKTGDLVRFLPNGELEFLGRMDHQVKVHGFRIELGEIEELLNKHEAVKMAVVVVKPDLHEENQLVAYLVFHPEMEASWEELRTYLSKNLPDYMLPAVIVNMAAFPLTPNGKIDRRALPDPNFGEQAEKESYVAPESETEKLLAKIWETILRVPQVGVNDNFFQIGGHSLLATRMLSHLFKAASIELPVRKVFENPVLGKLAAIIDGTEEGTDQNREPIPVIPREGELPLSFAQQRMLFIDHMESGTPAYNVFGAIRFTGTLDFEALQAAFANLIQRHEVLRTGFQVIDGNAQLTIAADSSFNIREIELKQSGEEARELEMQDLARQEMNWVFDLSKGPLLRARLLKIADANHVLFLNMHHIISDDWSIGVLLNELIDSYQEKDSLQPLPIQYIDYAQWQKGWLQTEAVKKQQEYWKGQLANAPAVLNMPTDFSRPPVQNLKGSSIAFSLSPKLTSLLRSFSQQKESSLYMTLLAAFQVLLARYSNQDDILVGSPIANRNREEVENLIGYFSNTLVMRSNLEQNPSFDQLLKQVKQTTLEAHENQDLPFEQLVDELHPQRDLSYSPIFQVMFVFQNAFMPEMEFSGLKSSILNFERTTSKFDLTLVVEDREPELQGLIEYNTELYKKSTIENMLQHFQVLLEGIVKAPEQPVKSLPILTNREFDFLTTNRAEPIADNRSETVCVHQLFEAQVEQTPENPAVTFEGKNLTYRELNEKANQLAHYLRKLGVTHKTHVGIVVERSFDVAISILAVLKAGGVYVPMDPHYPQNRIEYIAKDADVKAVILQEELKAKVAEYEGNIIALDTDRETIAQESTENLETVAAADSPCYIIYTSGSTGRPKGVVIPHSNVIRLFDATEHWFHFNQDDVWTLYHSYAFDFTVWEIWGALLKGGRLVVVPYLVSRSYEDFYKLLVQEKVTVLNQTPSAFRQLIQAEQLAGVSNDLALRYVIFGGEALEYKSLKPWFENHGDQTPELINMFGITETTVHVTYRPVRMKDVENGSGSMIGENIPDLEIYILDPFQQPVPTGVSGELYVGGAGLAQTYLNMPELYEERFIPHPFQGEGKRLYRTGDLARFDEKGDIEYLGRIDHQVQLFGFRIELGEIETVLGDHEAIQETFLMVREESGEKRLVAYLIPKMGKTPTTTELRDHLKTRLPEYMVPSAFIFMESFPLTANGKINRELLPVPDSARPKVLTKYVAPKTETEITLAEVWCEVLGLDQVGIHDNYFEMGGDSIRSLQVLSKAKAKGIEFTLQQFFQSPSIAQLAETLNHETKELIQESPVEPFALLKVEDRQKLPKGIIDAYPLNQMQMGMLFHMEQDPEECLYHNVGLVPQNLSFEADKMREAIAAVIKRHCVLRTAFDLSGYSEPLQLVYEEVEPPLEVEDLRDLSPEKQQERVDEWYEQEKKNLFDLAQPGLFRIHILLCRDDFYWCGITDNHAILDGWSFSSMMTEIYENYRNLRNGESLQDRAALQYHFRDYIALEKATLAHEEIQKYWLDLIADSTVTQIFYPTETHETGFGNSLDDLPPELCENLRSVAKLIGVPLKSVLLAAHMYILSQFSGQSDVITGRVDNNRSEAPDGDKVYGLFLNTMPFRQQLNGGSWVDLIKDTYKRETEGVPYRRFPIAELQRIHQGEAIFIACFNYTNFHEYKKLTEENLELGNKVRIHAPQNFEFSLDFVQNPLTDEIQLNIDFDKALFSSEQVAIVRDAFLTVLTEIARQPESNYHTFSCIPEEVKHQMLVEWNQTQVPYPEELCVHEQFEAQVEKTPENLAVVFGDQKLTYRELNSKANQLARYLGSKGVEPGSVVGLHINRSVEMITVLLGILKSGAYYLPIDVKYPADRISYLIENSGAKLLLTESVFEEKLNLPGVNTIYLDQEWSKVEEQTPENLNLNLSSKSLAYVIYTSGSTGQPKGVLIAHNSLLNFCLDYARHYEITEEDNFLQFSSIGFDAHGEEIYPTLFTGATVVIRPEEITASLPEFLKFMEQNRITIVEFTTAYWHEWVANLSDLIDLTPSTLRLVIATGEEVSSAHYETWNRELGDRIQWSNAYGPTEATITSSYYEPAKGEESVKTPAVPIGKANANNQYYVLNEYLQPVYPGVPGELHIGGVSLAWGYLKNPAQTAEKFIPDPFGDTPGGRLYKTGDLVRCLPNGNVQFLGRIDDQVKIRGFRIEMGEIESAIGKIEAVKERFVMIHEESPGDKRIVAYLVPQQGQELSVSAIRNELQETLPGFMVPTGYVVIDELPLTVNGKVDRRALPAPQFSLGGSGNYVAPKTQVEKVLASMWQEVLKVEQVGLEDDFFDLGGNSLSITQIYSRIRKNLKVEIPLKDLFRAKNIAQMNDFILHHEKKAGQTEKIAQIYLRLQNMSPEELKAMLEKKRKNRK